MTVGPSAKRPGAEAPTFVPSISRNVHSVPAKIHSFGSGSMAANSIHLPEVQRLSPLVLRLLGGNPGKFTLQGTNTYLIGTGSHRLLIDTGEGKPSWSDSLLSTLTFEHATVSDVLLTHWHHDHVGGVNDLLKLCPDARIHKHSPIHGQFPIEDGQRFTTRGAVLRALHCPGHTTDHMAFVLEQDDAMFTGDNVLGQGTAVFENLAVYMASLERMREQFSGRAYPGHGAIIDDGKARIKDYIEHRQQREREVLRVLTEARKGSETQETHDGLQRGDPKQGARTPMEMVKIIYEDVPETLHEPAAHGVELILHKLAKEEKVVASDDGHGWLIAESSSSVS